MIKSRPVAVWTISTIFLLVVLAATLVSRFYRLPVTLRGAVTVQDSDSRKELPIADVEVTAANNLAIAPGKSDSNGFFSITLRAGLRKGQAITLHFRHPDYQPLDLPEFAGDKLYMAHMVPLSRDTATDAGRRIAVGNVRVRYSIKAMTSVNIGSAVETFQVENKGNVPCAGHRPCSPDGKWKAASASASLDAGPGNEFRNARVSCIAGPCPFTRIESDGFTQGGQVITASARNWSDTATFLMEAEVIHPMVSEVVHQSYPVIFGRALNFTLPSSAEGVSIQADLDSETIVFPLGPNLYLSWANCNARVNPDQTRVYRCALKPGYQFR